jgi:hypothetical protein
MINAGKSAIFFSGLAENELFTHESLFVAEDVQFLKNENKSFFVSIMGVQQFSRGGETSIVNEMILAENGALASINAVGEHFVSLGGNFYESIWDNLYSDFSLGEILIEAINNSSNYMENRKFNIFGDPSIVLKTEDPVSIYENGIALPEDYFLSQNYPNPFNPSTTIKYTIPAELQIKNEKLKNVRLSIFDILGREIATLVNEEQKPGIYEVVFNASSINGEIPSGVYFYTLSTGNYVQTKKMVLLK